MLFREAFTNLMTRLNTLSRDISQMRHGFKQLIEFLEARKDIIVSQVCPIYPPLRIWRLIML